MKGNTLNICAISGRLVRNAVLRGSERKVLLFTVATQLGNDDNGQKERLSHVPCVVFGPSEELQRSLVDNGQGTHIELEGRIITSNYESNGERKFTTEVVAFNRSITLLKN